MTRRRFALLAAAALFALLLALYLRNGRTTQSASTPNDAAAEPTRPASQPGKAKAENASPETPSTKPAVVKLKGLRLLAKEEAEKRGWKAKSADGPTEAAAATLKVWREWKVTLQYEDFTLEDVIADLRVKLGLNIQVDPQTVIEDKTVTFKVSELQADQAMDLIFMMAELAWAVDPQGTTWITTRERAKEIRAPGVPQLTENTNVMMQAIRATFGVEPVPEKVRDERNAKAMAEWMADRKVTKSFVNLAAETAIPRVMEAGGLQIYEWSEAAKQAMASAAPLTLVGENLPLADTLDSMLKSAGLALDCAGGGLARVETLEERRDRLDDNGTRAKALALSRKEYADWLARPVRIEGKCLTLLMVLTQVSAQTAEPFILIPGTENCQTTWESDGLEQGLGEVLNILARDTGYCWAYAESFDVEGGPKSIWFSTLR